MCFAFIIIFARYPCFTTDNNNIHLKSPITTKPGSACGLGLPRQIDHTPSYSRPPPLPFPPTLPPSNAGVLNLSQTLYPLLKKHNF